MSYKITSIQITPLFVPFKELVRKFMSNSQGGLGMAISAEEPWVGGDFVICKVIDDKGIEGLGEVFVWVPETGVTPNQIIDIIKNHLAKYILGENPFNIEKIRYKMDINVAQNDIAKGLLDMACYDLMGRTMNKPVCDIIGEKNVTEIPLTALIPLTDLKLMTGIAKSYYNRGFRTLRIKLGNSIDDDLKIIENIRETLGTSVKLCVDYNQAYIPQEAVRAIKIIEPFNIEYAEQPVKADDFLGMAYVQKRVKIPLMAHEGFFNLRDLILLVELNAVGVLGLNTTRPGGLLNAIKALNYAKQKGMGAAINDQPLGIGSAMDIHLVAAKYLYFNHATELFGYEMFEDDLIKNPLDYNNGKVKVPEGSGWGVQLDEAALDKYSTSPTITLKQ